MYQGHKNWNHWNVSLWLFNEYPLYVLMCNCVEHLSTLNVAAAAILERLPDSTPDGAPYTFTTVRAAITHWDR